MPTQMELLVEASRRGILPADKQALFDEATNRGLIPSTEPRRAEVGVGEAVGQQEAEPSFAQPLFDAAGNALLGAAETGVGLSQTISDLRGGFESAIRGEESVDVKGDRMLKAILAEKLGSMGDPESISRAVGQVLPALALPGTRVLGGGVKQAIKGGLAATGTGAALSSVAPETGEVQPAPEALQQRFEGSTDVGLFSALTQAGLEGVGKGFKVLAKTLPKKDLLQEARQIGIDLTFGQASNAKVTPFLEQAAANVPVAQGIMKRHAQRTLTNLQSAGEDIAAKLGDVRTAEQFGKTLQKGAVGFTDRFKGKAASLYNKANKFFDSSDVVALNKTNGAIQDITGRFSNEELAGLLTDPKIQRIGNAIESGGGTLSYGDLNELRRVVGEKIAGAGLIADFDIGALKKLYGAISDDLATVAQSKGAGAVKAVKRASDFWKGGIKRIDDVFDGVSSSRLEPGRLLNKVLSEGKAGGVTIRTIKKSLKPEEFEALQSGIIRNMGRAKPGAQDITGEAFSPHTFLTNYNNLSKEAKDALFAGGRFASVKKEWDTLLKVTERLKDADKLANPSGTARNIIGAFSFFAPVASVDAGATAIGGVATASAYAKAITSPKFVKFMSAIGNAAIDGDPAKYASAFARLEASAMRDPELKEIATEMFEGLRE